MEKRKRVTGEILVFGIICIAGAPLIVLNGEAHQAVGTTPYDAVSHAELSAAAASNLAAMKTAVPTLAPVQLVAGRGGAVTLNSADIGDLSSTLAPYALSSSLSGFLTSSSAAAIYQPAGSYVTPSGLTSALTPYALAANLRTLTGSYTVQPGGANPLPAASTATGKLAYVSDWEGGPGYFLSDGTNWRQPKTMGKCRIVAASATSPAISVDAVKDTNCIAITGLVNFALSVSVVGPYDGYVVQVHRTQALSTVIGALGSIGVSSSGTGATSSGVTDSTAILQWVAASSSFQQVG